MSDDRSTFEVTRARLEDIVTQVRRKDVSLEQSLDMLEEAVRLVNQCNELIDQTSFRASVAAEAIDGEDTAGAEPGQEPVDVEVIEIVEVGEDGIVEVHELIDVTLDEGADGAAEGAGADETSDSGDEDGWGASDAWDTDAAAEGTVPEVEDDERE